MKLTQILRARSSTVPYKLGELHMPPGPTYMQVLNGDRLDGWCIILESIAQCILVYIPSPPMLDLASRVGF